MVDVLLIQGASEGANAADAKLAENLGQQLGQDFKVHFPRMPHEEEPEYQAWASTLAKELTSIRSTALVLVGHSLGASFLLRYLALNDVEPRPLGVFLAAAPFIGKNGWGVADFSLPTARSKLKHMKVFVFQGGADEVVPREHAMLYRKALDHAAVVTLAGRDHQLNEDMTEIADAIRSLDSAA